MIYTCKPAKVSLFDNRSTRYTAAKVKAVTGADIVLNGSLFNWSDYSPCCDIRVGGKTLNDDQWSYYGYGWNNGELPRVMNSNDMFFVDYYISCLWAIHNGEKQAVNDNQAGIGGTRGRTAFGFKADGSLVIIVTSDSSGAMKLSTARDKLFAQGCINGIILDGGGSSQIDTPGTDITSSRIVSNFICVWLPKETPEKGIDKMKLIAIDAGHGMTTAGKRCMKAIDPKETREWFLNNRIACYVEKGLAAYSCKTMRVDDITGKTDVPLATRVVSANTAKADAFCSIHANAGINGESGGGICVFTCNNPSATSVALQKAVYEATVAKTGLKGNRATPMLKTDFYVIYRTTMPAILGEYGFMDSTADTPIILTDDFAKKCAEGIVAGFVKVLELEKLDTSNTTYRVYEQVGAFTEEARADALKAELESKGYKAIIVEEVKL